MPKAIAILFCGKTGDEKTTDINSFFIIVKGIELGDWQKNYSIIESVKKIGQGESQTERVHLYYLRGYESRLIKIIEFQGNCDSRGK